MKKQTTTSTHFLYIDSCHENWDQMTPVEQGKYCAVCQKNVNDLTNLTPAQLASFLHRHRGQSLCGRVTHQQLQRGYALPNPEIRTFSLGSMRLLLWGTLLPMAIGSAQAQTISSQDSPSVSSPMPIRSSSGVFAKTDTFTPTDPKPNQKTLQGRLLDENGKPIIGAHVSVSASTGVEVLNVSTDM